MRVPVKFAAAVMAVSTACAHAQPAGGEPDAGTHDAALVGAWKPQRADGGDWAVLAIDGNGRFVMLAARGSRTAAARDGKDTSSGKASLAAGEQHDAAAIILSQFMDAVSGLWALEGNGGEVVLSFDGWEMGDPAWMRYLPLLLADEELRPYPGMRGRSPIASTSWRKVNNTFGRRFGR